MGWDPAFLRSSKVMAALGEARLESSFKGQLLGEAPCSRPQPGCVSPNADEVYPAFAILFSPRLRLSDKFTMWHSFSRKLSGTFLWHKTGPMDFYKSQSCDAQNVCC